MRVAYAWMSVVACLALEWAGAASGIPLLSFLPLGSFAVLWWMGRMAIVPRTAFALTAGFLLDSVFAHPFGTYMIVFLLLAGVAEFLHAFFSARDSMAARMASAAAMLSLFFILFFAVSRILAGSV